MKLPSPEAVLVKAKSAIRPRHRMAFLCTFFIGLAGHLYMFTNFLLNTDGPNFIYYSNNVAEQGRWLLSFASTISSDVNLPWVIGLLSLLYLSITAVVLVELLELDNKLSIFLVCAVLVLYPSVTETFSYLYTADPYMLALMLSALAVLCVKKWKWGIFPGAVLLLCSMGIYQAYISFAALLILLVVLQSMFRAETTLKQTLISLGRYLAMGVLGCLVNMGMIQLFLRIYGIQLTTVTSADMLGQSPLVILRHALGNLGLSYPHFFKFTFNLVGFQSTARRLVIVAYLLLLAAILVYAIVQTKAYKSPWRLAYIAVYIAVFPIAANLASLISGQDVHYLVIQPYCILFMLAAIAINSIPAVKLPGVLAHWATALITLAMCFQFVLTANIVYTSLHLRMERSYSITLRLADRIERTEGYYPGMPILIVGGFDEDYYPDTSTIDHLLDGMGYSAGGHILHSPNRTLNILRYYHGMTFDVQNFEEILNDPRVTQLGIYPQSDAIAIIDGVLVVRLNEEY